MKKVITLILVILPILLMVLISFTGRLYSTINTIDTESVYFADDLSKELPVTTLLVVDKGKTLRLNAVVKPDLATDKSVSYTSSNTACATVDVEGVVTGVDFGTTQITVKTTDGDYTDTIMVKVVANGVRKVEISANDGNAVRLEHLQLVEGERFMLRANVFPATASIKDVTWSCQDNGVLTITEKMVNGIRVAIINAQTSGICVITLRTNDPDSSAEAHLVVNVTDGQPRLSTIGVASDTYDYNDSSDIYTVYQDTIDLTDLILLSNDAYRDNLTWFIGSGSAHADLPYGSYILECISKNQDITIGILLDGTGYYAELKIVFINR